MRFAETKPYSHPYSHATARDQVSEHAQLFQYELEQIGIDVEIKQFPLAVWAAKIGTRSEPFDLTEDSFSLSWLERWIPAASIAAGIRAGLRRSGKRVRVRGRRGLLGLDAREPLEPPGEVPVPLAQQLHGRRQ
jgi:hypothetical protein